MNRILEEWRCILRTASDKATSTGVVKNFLQDPCENTRAKVGLFSSHGELAKKTLDALNEGKFTPEQLKELLVVKKD